MIVAFLWFQELFLPDQGMFLRRCVSKHEIAKNIKGRFKVKDHGNAKFPNVSNFGKLILVKDIQTEYFSESCLLH